METDAASYVMCLGLAEEQASYFVVYVNEERSSKLRSSIM